MGKKKEKKAVTDEGTVMGDALQKAGFKMGVDPAMPGTESTVKAMVGPDGIALLMTYEVVFSYEADSGKRYHQSILVSECHNAMDAQQTIKDEITKRGLDVDKIIITETRERPDQVKEAAVVASFPDVPTPEHVGELFPVPTKAISNPDDKPGHRMVNFHAKIVDVNVKQGDTRLLKIVMLVGTDIARVNSELLNQFKSAEMLMVTVEPFQLTTNDIKQHKPDPVTEAQVNMAMADSEKKAKMEKYICIHCGATVEADRENHPVDLKCQSCGKSFPIEFKADAEVEKDSDEDLVPEERKEDECVRCGNHQDELKGKLYCDKCWEELEEKK